MTTMKWDDLLNERRLKPKSDDSKRQLRTKLDDRRNAFEQDYDRVIFTSSFRRLQDKAQVFPLETSDFVRTRLTHSIEVSTIGRSLAIDVGRRLSKKEKGEIPESFDTEKIAAIVATTCLLHDVGNPPFGHYGESAIREWFIKEFRVAENPCLTKEQKADFLLFEGNAQALRIVTRLQMHNHKFGINLTSATLSSLIKYPCSSLEPKDKVNKAKSKPGYFQSEKDIFDKITMDTGTGGSRHPLVYLMEAADDIAYSVIDIEDAVKKGVLRFDRVREFLKPRLENSDVKILQDLWHDIVLFTDEIAGEKLPEHDQVQMLQLRILAHGVMIRACSDAFIAHYDEIMNGQYKKSLIDDSTVAQLYNAFTDLARDEVYTTPSVLTLEYLGREVIHGLLSRFVPAALSDNRDYTRTTEGKLYRLISPTFKYIQDSAPKESMVYNRLQLVTDFICGMTDSYALDLYQRLIGVKIK